MRLHRFVLAAIFSVVAVGLGSFFVSTGLVDGRVTAGSDVCSDYTPVGAEDDGSNNGNTPDAAIDGDTDPLSRWSSQGLPKSITVDLGSDYIVGDMSIMWFKGDERQAYFSVASSVDGQSWTSLVEDGESSGSSSGFESVELPDRTARFLMITGNGNSADNDWNSIIEIAANLLCDSEDIASVTEPEDMGSVPEPLATEPEEPGASPTPGVIGSSGVCGAGQSLDSSLFDFEGGDPRQGEGWVYDALQNGIKTENGNGPRQESKLKEPLREAMNDVCEEFGGRILVEMSDGGKSIVAQYHGSEDTLVKFYVSDTNETGLIDSEANNGIFDVYVRMRNKDGDEEKQALGTVQSGDSFDFGITNNFGTVTASAFGESFTLDVAENSNSYLKFGNYLQAQDPVTGDKVDSDDWDGFFEEQRIAESTLTFSNVYHVRSN